MRSPEYRAKMSQAMMGHPGPNNKGQRLTDEQAARHLAAMRLPEVREKCGEAHRGKSPWNKGRGLPTLERAERAMAHTQRRRAQKAKSPLNNFSARQWRALKVAFGFRCAYCKVKTRALTQDHVIPLSRGGSHTASNIVPACLTCNLRKGTGLAPEFQPVLLLVGKEE